MIRFESWKEVFIEKVCKDVVSVVECYLFEVKGGNEEDGCLYVLFGKYIWYGGEYEVEYYCIVLEVYMIDEDSGRLYENSDKCKWCCLNVNIVLLVVLLDEYYCGWNV